jgi:hypothetical protein
LRTSRVTLFLLLAGIAAANLFYFTWMWSSGNTALSSDPNLWSAYGSFIGGVLAPFSAFIASYLIYKNLQLDSYLKSLEIIRSSISRLDEQIYSRFETVITNPRLTEHNGRKIIDTINHLAMQNSNASEELQILCAGLSQDLGILSNSISNYMDLLFKIESNNRNTYWMIETEKLYWISRYSQISRKLIKIATTERVKEKLSTQQLASLIKVMHADQPI